MKINLYSGAFRALSILLAIVLSVIILIVPHAVTNVDNSVNHSHLTALLYGTMIGFIHGVGFVPESALFRCIFHPIIGWALMIGSSFVFMS